MGAPAIAAIVASQAAVNAAHQAEIQQCKTLMPVFNAQVATIPEMRAYAKCVETLYPPEIDQGTALVVTMFFVIGVVCLLIALFKDGL